MANVDVTELLTDPDFVNTFTVVRTNTGVDQHGRVVRTTTQIDAVGSVQPASGQALQLLPDLTMARGAIEIWTKFDFNVVTTPAEADQVIWQGRTYVAVQVDDYLNYGQGFSHAVLTMKNVT